MAENTIFFMKFFVFSKILKLKLKAGRKQTCLLFDYLTI